MEELTEDLNKLWDTEDSTESNTIEEECDNDVLSEIRYLKTIHRGYKNLLISGALPVSSNVVSNLRNHNIAVVVSLTENKLLSLNDPRVEKTNTVRFHYSSVDVADFDISKWFDLAWKDLYPFIYTKPTQNILFHCNEGKSRSVALLISVALNMISSSMIDDICYTDLILERIKMEREYAEPNKGFMALLYAYEKKLKA
jgi:predicted protein tyrosine phosphatase